MAGHEDFSDAHDPKYKQVEVPLYIATEENIKDYARFVHDFEQEQVWVEPWPVFGKRKLHPGTGISGGIAQGRVENYWEGDMCKQLNKARPDGHYDLGRLDTTSSPSNRCYVLCRGLNYHPDGGQVFFPTAKNPYIMLLALPGDDVKPEDFVAFYLDGTCGFQIKTGIWHNAPYQTDDRCFFDGKQNAVRACVFMDTVDEYQCYLKVPLKPEYATQWKK